jgi:heat shock protein HslJ
MQTRHLLTTMIVAIALMLGIVACSPAAAPTPTPIGETGGTNEETVPSGETGSDMEEGTTPEEGTDPTTDTGTDDSNGMGMNDLVGNWQVETITGEPVAGPNPLSLSFGTAGEVAGNGGCNGFGGNYTMDGSTMTISGLVSTMMACEDQTLMSQESSYFGTLEMVSTYTLEGDALSLLDADGNAIVTLVRV